MKFIISFEKVTFIIKTKGLINFDNQVIFAKEPNAKSSFFSWTNGKTHRQLIIVRRDKCRAGQTKKFLRAYNTLSSLGHMHLLLLWNSPTTTQAGSPIFSLDFSWQMAIHKYPQDAKCHFHPKLINHKGFWLSQQVLQQLPPCHCWLFSMGIFLQKGHSKQISHRFAKLRF